MDDFLEHIEKHKDEFYRYIYRCTWDKTVAEEIFSTAIYKAYKSRSKFTPGTNFRAWMFRIITNTCFVSNREVKRQSERSEINKLSEEQLCELYLNKDYKKATRSPDEFLEECGDEVFKAIENISMMEKSCILLRVMENFSYKEIAHILDIPFGTVMTHLGRGRAKLRNELYLYAVKEGIIKKRIIKFERKIS